MKRVTIRKEGNHYVVSVGGRGTVIAYTKKEALRRQRAYRRQLRKELWRK